MIGAFEVQKAFDAVLLPVLAALTPPVALVDAADPGQPYPFVEFSRLIATPGPLVSEPSKTVDVILTVYSQFRGQEQVAGILSAIETALDDQPLALPGVTAVTCTLTRSDTARDADGQTFTGTAIYSVFIAT